MSGGTLNDAWDALPRELQDALARAFNGHMRAGDALERAKADVVSAAAKALADQRALLTAARTSATPGLLTAAEREALEGALSGSEERFRQLDCRLALARIVGDCAALSANEMVRYLLDADDRARALIAAARAEGVREGRRDARALITTEHARHAAHRTR
jgi:hypothetical protein